MAETWCLATRNVGKAREFRGLLESHGYRLLTLDELGVRTHHEETGTSFVENARLKALAFSLEMDMLVLADDSGLEVAALHGRPGIHSARYAGPDASDLNRIEKLLSELDRVEGPRNARFVCALTLARRGEVLHESLGTCEGIIGSVPRGQNGFGYDPVFYFPELNRSFAELDESEKSRLSHRGNAVRALLARLTQ